VNYNIYITITFTGGNLDATTLVLYNLLYSKQPLHSMFKNGYDFNSVIKNGKSNLDHDLYNKAESLKILECINDYILQIDEIVCPCHHKFNCFLLQKVNHTFILTILLIINTNIYKYNMLYIGT